RCAPGRSRVRGPSLQRCCDRLLPGLERAAESVRILAARLAERGPSAAPAFDVLAELAHELRCVEAAADQGLVEVDDQIDAPVVDGTDDDPGGPLLLTQAIGQVSERATLERLRLRENDAAVVLHDLEVCD